MIIVKLNKSTKTRQKIKFFALCYISIFAGACTLFMLSNEAAGSEITSSWSWERKGNLVIVTRHKKNMNAIHASMATWDIVDHVLLNNGSIIVLINFIRIIHAINLNFESAKKYDEILANVTLSTVLWEYKVSQ